MFLEIEIVPSTLSLNCPWVALLRPLIPDSGIVVPIPTLSLIIAVPITSSSSLGWVVAIPTLSLTIAVPNTSSSWRGAVISVVPIPTLLPNAPISRTIILSESRLIKSWGAL